jgi:hypothetical protein
MPFHTVSRITWTWTREKGDVMDKKSIKILTKYFFPVAYGGTVEGDQNTPQEMAYLHSQGIHPESVLHITHAKAVARLRRAVCATDLRAVADAFIVGLHPDRCVHRAALRAFAIGMNFPAHTFQPANRQNPFPSCRTCGMYATQEVALALLELFRYRDGLCGFSNEPFNAAYALERFNPSEVPKPTADDFERINTLLEFIKNAAPDGSANTLAEEIRPVVSGNKYTRRHVLETLGYCSILETQDHKGYLDGWVKWLTNIRPPNQNNEMDLPVAWWSGKDGINVKALRHFFPQRQIRL